MTESNTTSTLIYPISIIDQLLKNNNNDIKYTNHTSTTINTNTNSNNIWSNRLLLQNSYTLYEKGWQIQVIWQKSQICTGIGVYANVNIKKNTILRIGILNYNIIQFQNSYDIEQFCCWNNYYNNSNDNNNRCDNELYNSRLQYVQDYLWGLYTSNTDSNGYPIKRDISNTDTTIENDTNNVDDEEERFIGMWIPGNGLNHSTTPNTVYRIIYNDDKNENDDHESTTNQNHINNNKCRRTIHMIQLVALTDIKKGDELYDDYNRHGNVAPKWLQDYATMKNITLNFANHNDFV